MEFPSELSTWFNWFLDQSVIFLCIGAAVLSVLLAKFFAPKLQSVSSDKKSEVSDSVQIKTFTPGDSPVNFMGETQGIANISSEEISQSKSSRIINEAEFDLPQLDGIGNDKNVHEFHHDVKPSIVVANVKDTIMKAFIPATKPEAKPKPSLVPKHIETFYHQNLVGKSVVIEKPEESMLAWMKKYESLQKHLASRPEHDLLKNAQLEFSHGNLESAERFLRSTLDYYIDHIDKTKIKVAEIAFDLGQLKELQYGSLSESKVYYEKAVQYEPKNLNYLKAAGYVKNTVKNYDQAIKQYQIAFDEARQSLGEAHPHVQSIKALLINAQTEHFRLSGKPEYNPELVVNMTEKTTHKNESTTESVC